MQVDHFPAHIKAQTGLAHASLGNHTHSSSGGALQLLLQHLQERFCVIIST
jgi:hypothetical protein